MSQTNHSHGPFRADHVGSLLRPESIHAARRVHNAARVGPGGFNTTPQLTDTDGEFRRSFWHYDFMGALEGLELVERDSGVAFHGKTLRPIHPTITGKLDFPSTHPMLEHFRFLAGVTDVQPKISIPGPSCCHFRVAKADIAPPEYADVERLLHDIAQTYRKAVQAETERWRPSSPSSARNWTA